MKQAKLEFETAEPQSILYRCDYQQASGRCPLPRTVLWMWEDGRWHKRHPETGKRARPFEPQGGRPMRVELFQRCYRHSPPWED